MRNPFFKIIVVALLSFQSVSGIAQCCNYKLVMHDSYGDGWNGGFLQVFVNNVLIGNYSAQNFIRSDSFQVCNGDSLKLFYTAGAYENENSYQLYDPAWNIIYAAGPNPAVDTVVRTAGNCSAVAIAGSNPCTAIAIDTGECLIANNTGYPVSGYNAGCANNTGSDIWFKIKVPPSGCLSIVTDSGSINDTGLAVWTDTTCTNLHSIGCDDDSGIGYFSFLSFYGLTPGQQLYIQVWGYNGATGTFRICANALRNILVDSTELPLIMIKSLGNNIVQNTKVNGWMDIKYNGAGTFTHFTDSSNVYSGNIGIEIHGATSAGYPQHPYGIETRTALGANNNVPLLGMPAENDWLLISNYNDLSLIRNTLAHKLFTEMGNYSPRTILSEVFLDSMYQGIYVFCEKIKRDHNRVRIPKMNSNDNAGDSLTGGYILQQNLWNASNSFQSNFSPIDHPGFDIHYLYEYPSADSITPSQKTYIAAFIDTLETALYSNNFADSTTGYRKYLDTKAFIDYLLVNELASNGDGFKKSVFFNKDRFSNGGKFKAGPVWDFDWAWKDFSNANGSGWAHHVNDYNPDNYSNGYYIRFLQDTTFANELKCRYHYYRQTILSNAYIFNYIDSMKTLVQHAQERHFQRWRILGMSGPAPEINPVATTYNGVIDTLKAWITRRFVWLDANMPGTCYPSTNAVSQLNAPQLLTYFPNPSNGTIHFEGYIEDGTNSEMYVYDATGKLIDNLKLKYGNVRFDYSLQGKGFYYFIIKNRNGIIQYGKLTVI